MEPRFVKIGRGKWLDRGPVRTRQLRSGKKKVGRFGMRRHMAMYEGELDRWFNRIETKSDWDPIVFCDDEPNNRNSQVKIWGRGAFPMLMSSADYQSMGDAEHEQVM